MIWPFNRKQEPEQSGVPADLVVAIEAATVVFRGEGSEGCPRCLVRISGMGAFYFDGIAEAAERFQRMHDLPPATARKAARLLASVVASRNRGEFKQPRQRRSGWVWAWED